MFGDLHPTPLVTVLISRVVMFTLYQETEKKNVTALIFMTAKISSIFLLLLKKELIMKLVLSLVIYTKRFGIIILEQEIRR